MVLHEEKINCIILNLSKKKKLTTRLSLNGKSIETVKEFKLLGTVITDNLKWDKKIKLLVKRAYSRMEILRQISKFTKSIKYKHTFTKHTKEVSLSNPVLSEAQPSHRKAKGN